MVDKVYKSDGEWQTQLSDISYRVTRKAGTEPAFSGQYWNEKSQGIYHCICCDQPLFDADTKYDSGTGWPSYYQPIDAIAVAEKIDRKLFRTRTEVICAKCDAHLGHVFPDGPEPTGLRYCMNSAALTLKKK